MPEININRRKANFRTVVLVIMVMLAVAIFILPRNQENHVTLSEKTKLGQGMAAPDFSLTDLNGNMVSLADYRGKAVLLTIWATWCASCVAEMPSMERLYQTMKGENFDIVAVSIDERGAEAVAAFMNTYKLNFTVLVDPKGSLKHTYKITGIPESYIIDKSGAIVEKVIGPRDWAAPDAVRTFRKLARENYLEGRMPGRYVGKFVLLSVVMSQDDLFSRRR